ncbi:urea-proton symporter DUR3-like [Elysia marginata]|uniref:Urea-proton symporter DUR3-like n=1 Tax=Elysia marginata TaxID=1093978 RepID=A0AAV4G0G1_9GAST|nr:urea-proton symporter DUR3-like [Elysia marginata]
MDLVGSVESWEALVLVCGLALGALLLAVVYTSIRRRVHGDVDTLDQAYDAGGKVSASLTAVCLAGQLLWPSLILQSGTRLTEPYIIGGIRSCLPVIITILLFPLLSLKLKTRAPGAKTFLQIIEARFGRTTHLLYCLFALLTNLVLNATLLMAGGNVFKVVVKDISDEMVAMVMAVLFGGHAFLSGLGAVFYVSYFNVATILCVMSYITIKMFSSASDEMPLGNFTYTHEKTDLTHLNVTTADVKNSGNVDDLAYWLVDLLVGTAKGTILCLAVAFCDQATWQKQIATKPLQGVLGFLGASFICFAIPASFGASACVAYYAMGENISTYNYSVATLTQNTNTSSIDVAAPPPAEVAAAAAAAAAAVVVVVVVVVVVIVVVVVVVVAAAAAVV